MDFHPLAQAVAQQAYASYAFTGSAGKLEARRSGDFTLWRSREVRTRLFKWKFTTNGTIPKIPVSADAVSLYD